MMMFYKFSFSFTSSATSISSPYSDSFGRSKKLRKLSLLMAPAAVEICVKGNYANPSIIGLCGYCQQILLTLEEKEIPYEVKLIELQNCPEWFIRANPGGGVPAVNFGNGKLVSGTDVLTKLIEEKYPEPSLKSPDEYASLGTKILFSFIRFLKSKNPRHGSEQAFLTDLTSLNELLKEHGPYVDGVHLSSVDLCLAPILCHAQILLGHYKNWNIPENLTYLHGYMKLLFSRESFIKTKAPAESIIADWAPKLK